MDNEQIFHLTEDLADDFTWMFAIDEVADRPPGCKAGPWNHKFMPRWMDANYRFDHPFTPDTIWAMYNSLEQFIGVMVELNNESVVLAQYDSQVNVLKWLSTNHMDNIANGSSEGIAMYRTPLTLYNAHVSRYSPARPTIEKLCHSYQQFSCKDVVRDIIIDFGYVDTKFSHNFQKVWGKLARHLLNGIYVVSGTQSQILYAGHQWFNLIEEEFHRYADLGFTGDGIIDSVTALGHLVAISVQLPTSEFMEKYRALWDDLPKSWRENVGIPSFNLAFAVQGIIV